MLPIRILSLRAAGRLAVWTGAVLLAASAVEPAEAKPLPVNGVEEFKAILVRDRSFLVEDANSADALLARRRQLQGAARRLPSLGEVTRVLLLPDWGSSEFDEFDLPASKEKIQAAARQQDDEAFRRDVQKLLKSTDDPSRIAEAVSAQIKRDLRQNLLDRLEERLHFYLQSKRPADRIAAANLVSDTMINARRQDNQELPSAAAGERRNTGNAVFMRDRLRKLTSDLQRLSIAGVPQTQVASIRALGNLESDSSVVVGPLQQLLTSPQSNLAARRATAEAFVHMVDIVYQRIQVNKDRREPPLRELERIFPAAASGLGDRDPQVRRSCLAACQEAATALDELVGDRSAALESRAVYRPMLRVVEKSLPHLNLGVRDSVPELRVAACHLLETLALITQKVNYVGEMQLTPPRPLPSEPGKKTNKGVQKPSPSPVRNVRRSSSHSSQWAAARVQPQTGTILLTPVALRPADVASAVSLGRPAKLPAASPSGVQTVAFRAHQLEPRTVSSLQTSLKDTVIAMIAGLSDPDYRVRLASVDVLETFGRFAEPAIPALVKSLGDSNKFVRWSAARTLGRLADLATKNDEAEKVVAGLIRLINDREDLSVRITALFAIEQYGPAAKDAVPWLARVINRGDKEYIIGVLRALQAIGTEAQPALPNVAWILHSREQPTSVRVEAARTLGRFGPLAQGELRGLRAIMVNDPNEEVRDAASSAVLAIDRPK